MWPAPPLTGAVGVMTGVVVGVEERVVATDDTTVLAVALIVVGVAVRVGIGVPVVDGGTGVPVVDGGTGVPVVDGGTGVLVTVGRMGVLVGGGPPLNVPYAPLAWLQPCSVVGPSELTVKSTLQVVATV